MDRSSNQVLQSPSSGAPVPYCVQPNAAANVANVANENVTNSSSSINIDHVRVTPLNNQVQPVGNSGQNILPNRIYNFDIEEAQPANAFQTFWWCKDFIRIVIVVLFVYAVLVGVAFLVARTGIFRHSPVLSFAQKQQPTLKEEHGGAAYDTGDRDEGSFVNWTGIKGYDEADYYK